MAFKKKKKKKKAFNILSMTFLLLQTMPIGAIKYPRLSQIIFLFSTANCHTDCWIKKQLGRRRTHTGELSAASAERQAHLWARSAG